MADAMIFMQLCLQALVGVPGVLMTLDMVHLPLSQSIPVALPTQRQVEEFTV